MLQILLFVLLSVLGHWWVMVPSAFISVLAFFHIDSYVADKYKINWLFWTLGIIFAILTVYEFIQLMATNK